MIGGKNMITYIKSKEQFEEEIKNGITLVDFYATWCGPCSMLAPLLEQLSEETNIKILKIDVDELSDLAEQYRIMSIPTLYLFKDGKLQKVERGYMPYKNLKEFINL